jgi:5-methylcytosine-specific restriction endonuclease McrA
MVDSAQRGNQSAQGGLSASVLVLNRFYAPVHVVSVRRAICLLFRDLAEVIHVEEGRFTNYDFARWVEMSELLAEERRAHDDWVIAIRFQLQVPRIIRLFDYDRLPRKTVRFSRRNIFARDGYRCMYCRKRFPLQQLSLDHVVPRSQGGATDWENIVTSCVRCNVKKGGRTPHEAQMGLAEQPVRPKRSPLLNSKLKNPKYVAWRAFLETDGCTVDVG